MPLAWKEKPLTMEWCLECPRNPAEHVRPKEAVFVMDWATNQEKVDGYLKTYGASDRADLGKKLVKEYKIQDGRLDNCSICHR
jgi:hypothetical protein